MCLKIRCDEESKKFCKTFLELNKALHVFVRALLIASTSRLCYVSGDIRHELSTLIGLSGMITELL